MTAKTPFETKTCSRCGGTGRHSFNYRDLDRCYGCGGTGVKYTARGRLAADRFNDLCSVRADEVQPGAAIWDGSVFSRPTWRIVESVKPDTLNPGNGLWLNCKGFSTCVPADQMVRVSQSPEEREAKLAEALAYQESLTKTGQPRKTRGAAA